MGAHENWTRNVLLTANGVFDLDTDGDRRGREDKTGDEALDFRRIAHFSEEYFLLLFLIDANLI